MVPPRGVGEEMTHQTESRPDQNTALENTPLRDVALLAIADRAIRRTTARMRRASLEFLWDKYVLHPER